MEGLMQVSANSKPACSCSARPMNAAALVRTERRESLFILRSSSEGQRRTSASHLFLRAPRRIPAVCGNILGRGCLCMQLPSHAMSLKILLATLFHAPRLLGSPGGGAGAVEAAVVVGA